MVAASLAAQMLNLDMFQSIVTTGEICLRDMPCSRLMRAEHKREIDAVFSICGKREK